jgi:hypothetical protein
MIQLLKASDGSLKKLFSVFGTKNTTVIPTQHFEKAVDNPAAFSWNPNKLHLLTTRSRLPPLNK